MVDRVGTSPARPSSPQEGPARSAATATSLAERSAGRPCRPTGASVPASRSRSRLAQIAGTDVVSAEQDGEAAMLVSPAGLDRPVAEAHPAVGLDTAHDRPRTVVKRRDPTADSQSSGWRQTRRHSARRFTPSCTNSITNSCPCDMIDHSDHGTPAHPHRPTMPIECVNHVSEHPSTISPVHTPQGRRGVGLSGYACRY
jgi:hypothetical protein